MDALQTDLCPSGGVFTRGGVMFFILLFNALLAMAELTASFESRPIMLKHKSLYVYLLQNTVKY